MFTMEEFIRPEYLNGSTIKGHTPFGNVYVTINRDEYDNPVEVFITIGKAGSDLSATAECIARLISMNLQSAEPKHRIAIMKEICDSIKDIGGSRISGVGDDITKSLPDAVGKIICEEIFNKG